MAVYTELHEEKLLKFLKLYDIGDLILYNGITEGIENSNFFIKTTHGKFILTIFENRVRNCVHTWAFYHRSQPITSRFDSTAPIRVRTINDVIFDQLKLILG